MSNLNNYEIETTITATNKRCLVAHREVIILVAAEQGFESHEDMADFQNRFYEIKRDCYTSKGKALNAARAMARGNQFMDRDGLIVVQLTEGHWWVGGVDQQLLDTLNN